MAPPVRKSALPEILSAERAGDVVWKVAIADATAISGGQAERLVRTYDGSSDPERWFDSIREVGEIAKWSEDYAIMLIKSRLTGKALAYIENCLPVGEHIPIGELEALLVAEFKPKERLVVRLHRLISCSQDRDESVTAYAARLRAVGNSTCETDGHRSELDRTLLALFLPGLRKREVLDMLMSRDPKNFSEAVRLAQEAEAQLSATGRKAISMVAHDGVYVHDPNAMAPIQFQNSSHGWSQQRRPAEENSRDRSSQRRPGRGSPASRRIRGGIAPQAQTGTRLCSWCATHTPSIMTNHERADCKKRLRSENRCFQCKRQGHVSADCPGQPGQQAQASVQRPRSSTPSEQVDSAGNDDPSLWTCA